MRLSSQIRKNHQGNILIMALLTFVLVIIIIATCLSLYQTKLEIINNLILDYDHKINEQWTKIKS